MQNIIAQKQPRQDQIDFGLKTKRFQPFALINRKLQDLEMKLEVMPFWKNLSFVFAAFSSVVIPAGLVSIMIYKFNQIPMQIPLFYDPVKESWQLVDKSIAIVIPISYGILNLILLNINNSVFQFDRRLSQVLIFTMNIANILFLIAFSQILSIALL